MLDFFTTDFVSDIIQSVSYRSLKLECMEENYYEDMEHTSY